MSNNAFDIRASSFFRHWVFRHSSLPCYVDLLDSQRLTRIDNKLSILTIQGPKGLIVRICGVIGRCSHGRSVASPDEDRGVSSVAGMVRRAGKPDPEAILSPNPEPKTLKPHTLQVPKTTPTPEPTTWTSGRGTILAAPLSTKKEDPVFTSNISFAPNAKETAITAATPPQCRSVSRGFLLSPLQ